MLKRLFVLVSIILLSLFTFSTIAYPVYANDLVQSYALEKLISSAPETVTEKEFVPTPDTRDLRNFISNRARIGSQFDIRVYGIGLVGSGEWIEINPNRISADVCVDLPVFDPICFLGNVSFEEGDRIRLESDNYHGGGGYRIDIGRGGRAWLNFENFAWDSNAAPPVSVTPRVITRWNDRETRVDYILGVNFQAYLIEKA